MQFGGLAKCMLKQCGALDTCPPAFSFGLKAPGDNSFGSIYWTEACLDNMFDPCKPHGLLLQAHDPCIQNIAAYRGPAALQDNGEFVTPDREPQLANLIIGVICLATVLGFLAVYLARVIRCRMLLRTW